MSLTVIYIHGFNSSPLSTKAQQLQAYFSQHKLAEEQGCQLFIPALNHQPAVAIQQLQQLIEVTINAQPAANILLIGSSLGGYYSIWLAQQYPQCRAVLINPAVYPYRLLKGLLGENQNLYTAHKYQLSTEHIAQLQALEVSVVANPQRMLLLSQTGDETLDYREAVDKLAAVEQRVTAGGNHGFENFVVVIPEIFDFVTAR
ncbi:MAG: putative esterase [Osedax symbiont Rs1]|nr:MAG: putative esterase [Osedax symbiont Rs1]